MPQKTLYNFKWNDRSSVMQWQAARTIAVTPAALGRASRAGTSSPLGTTPPNVEELMERAGFAERLVALVIDDAVLAVCCLVLGLVIGTIVGAIGNVAGDETVRTVMVYVWALVIVGVPWVYWPYFWISTGQTPGMKIVKIKVIGADGSRVTGWQGIVRYVIFLLSWLAFGLGLLWVAFDKEHQGWHDKVAGTYVVGV